MELDELPSGNSEADFKKLCLMGPTIEPNKDVGVRIIRGNGVLAGQFEAYARHALGVGELVPIPGKVCDEGRENYDVAVELRTWKRHFKKKVLDPSLLCAGTYVNDFCGPEQNQAPMLKHQQNVVFHFVGGIYVFWKVIKPIEQGEALWGDYGPQYWQAWEKNKGDQPRPMCMWLQKLLAGESYKIPIQLHDIEN